LRLDRDGIDRSPLDRSGESLQPGEFIVRSYQKTGGSVALSNESIVVLSVLKTGGSVALSNESIVVLSVLKTGALVTPSILFSIEVSSEIKTGAQVTFTAPTSITISSEIKTGALVTITPLINLDKLFVSGSVRRSLIDKMASGTFDFDKTTVAGLLSTLFWTKLTLSIPDYSGRWNTVFVGIAPSSQTNFTYIEYPGIALGNQTLKVYDYSWYLTNQTLEPDDLVLLTWADQQADLIYTLDYRSGSAIGLATPGNRVKGDTSGDGGTIIALNTSAQTLTLKALTGSSPYFSVDEQIRVNGYLVAIADSAAYDAHYYPNAHVYPTNFIWKLLGGYDAPTWGGKWAEMTGIKPTYAGSDASWVEREFIFTEKTTKAQAIEQICQYMKWIFYIRYYNNIPEAWFFDEANLDTVGCLPDPVYVTSTTDHDAADARKHLISPFTLVQAGENQYNWFHVRCQGLLDGEWYDKIDYVGDVYDPVLNSTGSVIKRPYYEPNNTSLAVQADCDARVTDLKTYYQKQVCTWTATFTMRSDFVLLQKLIISGYGAAALPDGDYRIIDIQYDYRKSGTENTVTVKIINDDDFRAYLNLKRVYMNSVLEIQNIAKDIIDKNVVNQTGTVIITSGNSVIVALDGNYGAVKRTAYGAGGTFTAGDKVTMTLNDAGRLIATKI